MALSESGKICCKERGDGILVEVAEQYEKRGEGTKAKELLSRVTDPLLLKELAQPQTAVQESTSSATEDVCSIARQDAQSGETEQALKRLNDNNCDCLTRFFVQQKASLLEQAAASLQSCAMKPGNDANVSSGMAELASLAANRGDIELAIKLSEKVMVTGADYEEGYLEAALRDIARNWASQDPVAALRWATTRKKGLLRAMAVLGVAEAYR